MSRSEDDAASEVVGRLSCTSESVSKNDAACEILKVTIMAKQVKVRTALLIKLWVAWVVAGQTKVFRRTGRNLGGEKSSHLSYCTPLRLVPSLATALVFFGEF